MSDSNIPSQDNNPDTRSGPDHQQLNQTDQGTTDVLNTSGTDIQVHSHPASSVDAKSIKIGNHIPATNNSNPPFSTSTEAHEQPSDVHPTANPSGKLLLDAMWPLPDRVHQIGSHDRQNNIFKNLPVDSAADAIEQALNLSSDGIEAYFACAEYLNPDSRTAANASGACGFWMDIDCGKDKAAAGKGYATVEEAEIALSKFCKDAGLPKPTHIVHSGGGLHAYWVVA